MTSAVRVGGERLYRKAHRGETVGRPNGRSRSIGPSCWRATLRAPVRGRMLPAGTYIRTLVETLDDAYCAELRRTAIGPFKVEDAGQEFTLAKVAELVPSTAKEGPR